MARDYEVKFASPTNEYDPEKPNSNLAARGEYLEHLGREQYVNIGHAKNIQEKLKQCWLREGVNHFDNCRDLAHAYKAATEKVGLGWKFTGKAPAAPVDDE
uniref:NADH dehydrogenase [ubiquinone] 1 beta subcomplex subunit 10 n=1 Tax=Prasinoderma coloniale TaxID=156133 RepID=A0A7R9XYP8_9VIRI|mmetsp:Transcript_14148/g.59120  ORF Transcript_14148/g.59120 Transcript_14148/m.59120 type:complete len:101 (+) Transcript_14148:220-522(+)|eukprot:PRCOL_00001312-RA